MRGLDLDGFCLSLWTFFVKTTDGGHALNDLVGLKTAQTAALEAKRLAFVYW